MANISKKDALKRLRQLRDEIAELKRLPRSSTDFSKWRRDTEVAIERIFGQTSSHIEEFHRIDFDDIAIKLSEAPFRKTPDNLRQRAYISHLLQAETLLESMLDEIKSYWSEDIEESNFRERGTSSQLVPSLGSYVFIGHGRSPLWARLQVFLEKDLGLKTINYESESRVGKSIVTVLEQMLDEANFAVLILTAEDETASGKRARQNVVHEAGLFQGRLGFNKAVLLVQEGLEEFSNVAGLQHIPFTGDRIDQTFNELRRALKREGLVR